MPGRPPLRIGHHGCIRRVPVADGIWLARCRFRDTDGVTRVVERRGPTGDKYGKAAEDKLIEALADRQAAAGEITSETKVVTLVDKHIDRLEEDGRAQRTLDTYRYCAKLLGKQIAGVRIRECTPARIDAAIRTMRRVHGDVLAIQSKTVLKGALHLAVMATVLQSNPVRDVSSIRSSQGQKGAKALTADELRDLLGRLSSSQKCQHYDLADAMAVLIATGLRRSELLGLRWEDFDPKAGTLTVEGKVIRAAGKGLMWVPRPKTEAGRRTIPLPPFAISILEKRRSTPWFGEQKTVFASSTGALRDPDGFNSQWSKARDELGAAEVTSHSFRKSIATLIDDAGLSPRVGADQLGHSRVSETQDTYMARGRIHQEVANVMETAMTAPKRRSRKR